MPASEQPPDLAGTRPLAELGAGRQARVVAVQLGPPGRVAPGSPLRPGALVHVVEATREWLHVRIDFREWSVPVDLAARVLVAPTTGEPGESQAAVDAFAVLFSRVQRERWQVRVVRRADGSVVASWAFDDEAAARRHWEALRADALESTADGFRARHGLGG